MTIELFANGDEVIVATWPSVGFDDPESVRYVGPSPTDRGESVIQHPSGRLAYVATSSLRKAPRPITITVELLEHEARAYQAGRARKISACHSYVGRTHIKVANAIREKLGIDE